MRLVDALPAEPSPDALLDAFTEWTAEQGLVLYPHQEEAVIELFAGQTPSPPRRPARASRWSRSPRTSSLGRPTGDLLHGADQGAREGEVLRLVQRSGPRRRDAHGRRGGEPARRSSPARPKCWLTSRCARAPTRESARS